VILTGEKSHINVLHRETMQKSGHVKIRMSIKTVGWMRKGDGERSNVS